MEKMRNLWRRRSIVFLQASFFLLPAISSAQITFEKYYGGDFFDEGYSVLQTQDGGYIIAGRTDSFGAGSHDVYLIKTDSLGNSLWTKTYGGNFSDQGFFMQQTTDGGFIITGRTASFFDTLADVYLVKTDSVGDTLWTRTYGDTTLDIGHAVQQTSDGGYIITGMTEASTGPWSYDLYLIKTDSLGSLLWQKTYGDTADEWGNAVLETSDGGYIITGRTASFGSGLLDLYLMKTDSSGDTLWTKTYGGGGQEEGFSIHETPDGGFIISGVSSSFGGLGQVYLLKTDSLGDTLWTRLYGGSGIDFGYSLDPTSDGGYIIAGKTRSFGAGEDDVYLLKTDSLGDTLWTRTYGGVWRDKSYSVKETSDGGYIIAGMTQSFGPGQIAVYLIKTDGNGMVVGIDEGSKLEVRIPRLVLLQNQPNPFSSIGRTEIGYSLPKSGSVTLKIYDISGRLVDILVNEKQKSGVYQVNWDGKNQATGIYFYRLQVDLGHAEDFSATKKLILLR